MFDGTNAAADTPQRGGRLVAIAVLGMAAVVAVFAVFSSQGGGPAAITTSATDAVADVAGGADSNVADDADPIDEPNAVEAVPSVVDQVAEAALPAAAESDGESQSEQGPEADVEKPVLPVGPMLSEAPPILGVQAELANIDGWLQSDIDSLADLDGKVHVVQFWTFGCYNCKNTIPNLIHLDETYGGDDFEIVGVHAPEFDYEKDPDAILEAAERLGVTWPIALDNDKTNFRSWQESRRFWPRTYVIDQAGNIRFDRIGEGAYEQLEATVAWLLRDG